MIELCDVCGAVQGQSGGCSCGGAGAGAPLALDLELDRGPPVVPSAAPRPMMAPLPRSLPPSPLMASHRPPVPLPLTLHVSNGMVRLVIIVAAIAVFVTGLYFGVQKLRSWGEDQVDQSATRPYPAPNRLVIAAVTSDYGSSVTNDGSVLLQKTPRGPAAGLLGFYAPDPTRVAGALEQAVAATPGATYRALEAPTGKCRSDAETSTSTLGEITAGEHTITVFTCVLTKKNHLYFLAWAAASADVDDNRQRLEAMLKSSQLVSNNLCSVNVLNAGCSPSAASLVTALVESARR